MKNLLVILFLLSASISNAADIVGYKEKEQGERVVVVLNTNAQTAFAYIEDDKTLEVYAGQIAHVFRISSYDEAMKTIKRLLDDDDKALIELEYE